MECNIGELMKSEKWNLCNLFAVLMSLCESDIKNQVETSNEYATLEKNLEILWAY